MKAAVFDSYALITYLQRQAGYKEVAKLFEECTANNREVFLCVVNWGEVIYHALRTGGEQRAQLAEGAMRAIPVTIIEANKDITLQAAKLKAVHRMSYADCFAAAVAMKKKCELVTGDKEFKHVEKEIKIHWIT
jgi:predicted nucleic acid-binding protein